MKTVEKPFISNFKTPFGYLDGIIFPLEIREIDRIIVLIFSEKSLIWIIISYADSLYQKIKKRKVKIKSELARNSMRAAFKTDWSIYEEF